MRTLSLCITTWNRFDFTIRCLAMLLNDDRISEICISDDCSTDGSYEEFEKFINAHPRSDLFKKVKFFKNETNQGCYRNKMISVSLATNPWVIVFDSDNMAEPSYLDALYAIPEWDEHTVYQPDFAMPHFDFTHLGGLTITKNNVQEFLKDRMATTLINAMNYVVFRKEYLRVFDSTHLEPWAADSIIQNYNWLNAGNSIYVVPGMRYYHVVHDQSHFKQHQGKSLILAGEYEKKLHKLQ